MDLALNNLQRLICHKTHQTKPITKQVKEVRQILIDDKIEREGVLDGDERVSFYCLS